MSNDAIDAREGDASQGEPERAAAQPDADAPQDDSTPEPQDASGREKKYRLELRQEQAERATEREQHDTAMSEVTTKLRSTQRTVVNQHLAGRIRDLDPFWHNVDHADLLDENGDLDLARVDQAAGDLLAAKAYLTVPTHAAIPTDDAKIGFPSVGAVNQRYEAEPAPGWSEVLRAAAEG